MTVAFAILALSLLSEPQLTRPPELLRFVSAEIPASESARTSSVATTISILIDETGAVREALVLESSGSDALDSAALAAVRAFEFSPAEVDGAPSAIRILYRYVFAFVPPPPKTAALEGTVRDRETKQPLANIRITLTATLTAITDAEGRFEFTELDPGTRTLSIEGEHVTPVQTREELRAGEKLEVAYEIGVEHEKTAGEEEDDLEIVVTAPAIKRQTVATRVLADEARRIPGTSGDVVRVVESLPGVARAGVGSGALVVWGAAPEDTRVYVDGVPIPRLYHEGGLRSVVHSDLVDNVELIPGGAGAAFGRNLAGIVTVQTKTPLEDGVHGSVSADLLDSSAAISSPLSEHTHASAAARMSLLDLWAASLLGSDVSEYLPIPRYRDAQLRFALDPSASSRLELVALGSSDRFARGVKNADPALSSRESRALDFARVFMKWSREENGTAIVVTPWLGADRSDRTTENGDVATRVRADVYAAGLRASYRRKIDARLTLEGGIDAELSKSDLLRRGSIGLPSREGDVRAFGEAPPDQIGADDWSVTSIGIAPYAEANIELFEVLTVTPGLRFDPYARSVSRRLPQRGDTPAVGLFLESLALEPRLSMRWRVFEGLALRAAFAVDHQPPAAEDLSPSFGTPDLPISRSFHWIGGADVSLPWSASLELTGFWVESDHLAVRDRSLSPLTARALAANGEGRNFGAQVLLRKELAGDFSGWIAYTLMRSDRREHGSDNWRASDFEQTHVLSAVLAYRLPFAIDAGLRFRYATGFPRTEVVGAVWDARRDQYAPVFGAQNGIRVPTFVQVDLRFARTFELGGTALDVSLEVLNVANTDNVEELVYAPDYSTRGFVKSLPILPVLGARWTF